jgi:hypothetical protein
VPLYAYCVLLCSYCAFDAGEKGRFESNRYKRVSSFQSASAGKIRPATTNGRLMGSADWRYSSTRTRSDARSQPARRNSRYSAAPRLQQGDLCEIPQIQLLTSVMEKHLSRVDPRTVKGEMVGPQKKVDRYRPQKMVSASKIPHSLGGIPARFRFGFV